MFLLLSILGCENKEVITPPDKETPIVVDPPVTDPNKETPIVVNPPVSDPKEIISEATFGLLNLKLIGKDKYMQGEELDIVLEVTYLGDDEFTFTNAPKYHVFVLRSVEGDDILDGIQELSSVEHVLEPNVVYTFEIDDLRIPLREGGYVVEAIIYIGLVSNQNYKEFRYSRKLTFEVIS